MSDLADFLLARIAEDEDVLTRPEPFAHYSHGYDDVGTYSGNCPTCRQMIWVSHQRALAECEAKRRIVGLEGCYACSDAWTPCEHREMTLRLLALPYADHEAYDESWRP